MEKTQPEVIEIDGKHYHKKYCKKCNTSLRYISKNNGCVTCKREYAIRYNINNRGSKAESRKHMFSQWSDLAASMLYKKTTQSIGE